jgi:GNAT superfamily N-acetyltransferase
MVAGAGVRAMTSDDAQAVASLCHELGYPATPAQIERRFHWLERDPDQGLFVAQSPDGQVVGWLHTQGRHFLESEPYAEIGGLVVQTGHRRQGIGAALLAEAEEWASRHGYAELRVRSNMARTEAHQFYPSKGFRLAKTQHVYVKSVVSHQPSIKS